MIPKSGNRFSDNHVLEQSMYQAIVLLPLLGAILGAIIRSPVRVHAFRARSRRTTIMRRARRIGQSGGDHAVIHHRP